MLTLDRTFLPLEADELTALSHDEGLHELYCDGLGIMHDILCRHVDGHGRPRFEDLEAVRREFEAEIRERKSSPQDQGPSATVIANLEENSKRARELGESAAAGRYPARGAAGQEIKAFLDAIVFQYTVVIRS